MDSFLNFMVKRLNYYKITEKLSLFTLFTSIYRWAGIKDGRYSRLQLEEMAKKSSTFGQRNDILKTHILIIDEISMISAHILNQVSL